MAEDADDDVEGGGATVGGGLTPPEGSGSRVAAQFQDRYPDVDARAIEACLGVMDGSVAEKSALARYFETLGTPKSQARFAVLRAIYFADSGRLAQHEIGSDMRVTSSNVTRLIDGLEKEGLVSRTPDTTDRRVTYIQLTPEGEKVTTEMIPAMAGFMKHMLRGFSAAEKSLFNEFLERFHRNAVTSYVDTAED